MRIWLGIMAAALAAGTAGAAPGQDRDPAYQAARDAGKVGEKPDGYLGIVGASTPDLEAMVKALNIKRKKLYTQSAADEGTTVEKFGFVTGCNLILQTAPGEKYQTPAGEWRTRTAEPPLRDSRCV